MTDINETKSESAMTQRAKRLVSEKIRTKSRLNAHIDPGDLTTIVTVFTSGRSGTTLTASLLDSHPYIASTPDQILHGFYVFWESFGDLESEALTEATEGIWDFRQSASPDGKQLLFCRAPTGAAPTICVAGAEGEQARPLTQGWREQGADHPRWL